MTAGSLGPAGSIRLSSCYGSSYGDFPPCPRFYFYPVFPSFIVNSIFSPSPAFSHLPSPPPVSISLYPILPPLPPYPPPFPTSHPPSPSPPLSLSPLPPHASFPPPPRLFPPPIHPPHPPPLESISWLLISIALSIERRGGGRLCHTHPLPPTPPHPYPSYSPLLSSFLLSPLFLSPPTVFVFLAYSSCSLPFPLTSLPLSLPPLSPFLLSPLFSLPFSVPAHASPPFRPHLSSFFPSLSSVLSFLPPLFSFLSTSPSSHPSPLPSIISSSSFHSPIPFIPLPFLLPLFLFLPHPAPPTSGLHPSPSPPPPLLKTLPSLPTPAPPTSRLHPTPLPSPSTSLKPSLLPPPPPPSYLTPPSHPPLPSPFSPPPPRLPHASIPPTSPPPFSPPPPLLPHASIPPTSPPVPPPLLPHLLSLPSSPPPSSILPPPHPAPAHTSLVPEPEMLPVSPDRDVETAEVVGEILACLHVCMQMEKPCHTLHRCSALTSAPPAHLHEAANAAAFPSPPCVRMRVSLGFPCICTGTRPWYPSFDNI
ncbi:hypothetical protein C7M84_007275 [Penaeus vannamei]|uniref:Uncharacterized protein n=1 Tax=Penaeus vannamei TaxID=6689 RepID=A0A423TCQ2_PENVA|nr:hypothetical protein C7M84_007275 [Penaeus vannamei]